MVSCDFKRLAFVLCLNNPKRLLKTNSKPKCYQRIGFWIIMLFYLHLNFRHTIQCVHDSKASTGRHLGGCSPHKRIQAWHPCFWIAKSREISHCIRSVGTRTCNISFPQQWPNCSLLGGESLSPPRMAEQRARQKTALENTTYSQD